MIESGSLRRFAIASTWLAACARTPPEDGESSSDNSTTGSVEGSTAEAIASTGAATTGETDATSSTETADATSATGDDDGSSGSTGTPSFADPRGYTLIAPLGSRFTHLIDADGLEINRWESATAPANSAYLIPDGRMLRVARDPSPSVELVSGAGGIVEMFDWAGNVSWQYAHTGAQIVAHHDIAWMPNGHVLIIAYEMFSVDDAIAAGRDPALVAPEGLWADYLVEVDPRTDDIVWEWHVWDHLVQDHALMADNFGVVADHPELIDINWTRPGASPRPDWTHTNAVAYDAQLDQIVLSPRTFSEIWIIDHSTTTQEAASHAGGNAGRGGDLLYRWGNPATYDAGDELDRQLFYQHNPHWIAPGKPGAGNLLIFDNGDPVLRPWSRVVEIAPPLQPDGTYLLDGPAYGPLAPILVYEDPPTFFAAFISGANRLEDGRTVVCDGPDGQVFEVEPDGSIGWTFSVEAQLFRAQRYGPDDPAFDGLSAEDLAPGDPVVIELE